MSSSDLFAVKPTLTGNLIELRPFDEQAISAMLDILSDPEVLIKTGSVHSPKEAETKHPLDDATQWYQTRNQQDDRLDLAIFDVTQQQYVGEVVFNEYNPHNRSVNYRIAIGSAGRGKGLGTEATQLMIDYGFETLNLNRIELEVFEFNQRARYVYTSCGFVTEGRRRQALFYDGTFHDALIKSIIRDDWEQSRKDTDLHTASLPVVKL